jgi:GAF domain-containing protein
MRAGQLVCERAEGIEAAELLSQAAQVLASASRRPVPLVISDTSTDDRFALGPRFARGSIAAIPIAGAGAVLFAHDARPEGISSTDLELLVMLGHQLTLLMIRTRTN